MNAMCKEEISSETLMLIFFENETNKNNIKHASFPLVMKKMLLPTVM